MKSEYTGINIGKFIMAILVVGAHTQPFFNNWILKTLFDKVILVAVPFFFLSSGFFLDKKISRNEYAEAIVSSTIIKYVKLYVVWSVLYLPLAIYFYKINGYSVLLSTIMYFKDLIFVGDHYNSWSLWFLLSSIYAFIIIYLITKNNYSKKSIFLFALISFAISICIDQLLIIDQLSIITRIRRIIDITINNSRIMSGCYWIPLGILISKCDFQLNLINRIIILILGSLMMCFSNILITKIGLILVSIVVFLYFLKLDIHLEIFTTYLRKLSSSIYYIHLYIWTFYYVLKYNEKTYGMDSFIFTVICSIIISIIYDKVRCILKCKLIV